MIKKIKKIARSRQDQLIGSSVAHLHHLLLICIEICCSSATVAHLLRGSSATVATQLQHVATMLPHCGSATICRRMALRGPTMGHTATR